jgi:hypothetical protein
VHPLFGRIPASGPLGHRHSRRSLTSHQTSTLTPKQRADQLVDAFALKRSPAAFPNIDRAAVAAGLHERVADPDKIDQGGSSLCGPAAIVHTVAVIDPVAYVIYVTSLYDTGRAQLRTMSVVAGSDLKAYRLGRNVNPADWIALASIRDSENWFFDYQEPSDEAAGITIPDSLESWFKRVGFTEVINRTNVFFEKDTASIRSADDLFGKSYWVCLLVNDELLYDDKMNDKSLIPTHWVVLTDHVVISGGNISLTVYSWGDGHRTIPQDSHKTLSMQSFLGNYYGYVAAKG